MTQAVLSAEAGKSLEKPATWTSWPVLVGLLGALTLLRLIVLFASPSELGFDEAQYWAWSREFAFGYFTKPPLIAWIIGIETRLCGSGAACVRAASPLFHFGTALVLAALARRLYGPRTGFWTGIFYGIMPAVALSSFLMTTDVFLLFFWSLALYTLIAHVERPSLAAAIGFGLATGIGLYAKYAMIYLPLMAIIAAFALPELRRALLRREAALALLIILAVIAPNLWWNATNGFATFEHTGDNIGWSLSRINPVRGFEFLGAQFGVAGPILFGAMIAALFRRAETERPEIDRLLLWLSWPVLLAITLQGFLSRANANWGATAYPAGIILATALIVGYRRQAPLVANLAICGVVSIAIMLGAALIDPKTAEGPLKQLRQLGGWSETASGLSALARERNANTIVIRGRALTAGMIHALRDAPLTVLAYRPSGTSPADQFQLQTPWSESDATEGVLLFGFNDETAARLGATPVATIDAPIYSARSGTMTVYGFDEPPPPSGANGAP